jgi:pro-sigmaK processing inhibitor BofA
MLTGVWTRAVRGMSNDMRLIGRLIVNTIVGLILLFVTNLFLSDEVPLNLLTIVICAIGGVVGWVLIVLLHFLGVAF